MDAVENGPEIASQWQALKDNDNTRQRLFEVAHNPISRYPLITLILGTAIVKNI